MATDNEGINLEPLNSSIQNSGRNTVNAVNQMNNNQNTNTQLINNQLNNLNDGVDLLLNETEVQRNLNEIGEYLSDRVAEIVNNTNQLIQISNNKEIIKAENNQDENKEIAEEKEFTLDGFNSSIRDISSLGSSTSIQSTVANGFALLTNTTTDLLRQILQNMTPLQVIQVVNNTPVTTQEVSNRENVQTTDNERGVNNLRDYLTELIGPLNSIASGMMLLSISIVALSIMSLNPLMLPGIIIFMSTLMLTFAAISELTNIYNDQFKDMFNPESTTGTLAMIKDFAIMVGLISATFITLLVTIQLIQANLNTIVLGLLATFGVMLISLTTLTLLSSSMQESLGPDSPITNTLKAFSILVLEIVVVTLVCAFALPYLSRGAIASTMIFGSAVLMINQVRSLVESTKDIDPSSIQSVQNILVTVNVLVGMIGLFTIALGLIPMNIVLQGVISVGLLMGLVDLTLLSLRSIISKLENINSANMQSLQTILITTTVMIGLLGVLVIALSLIPLQNLITSIASLYAIMTIPIVAIQLFSKIGQNTTQLTQALQGLLYATLITTAISVTAFLITTLIPDGVRTMIACLAVVTTAVALMSIGLASILLAGLASVITPIIGPALIAVGLTALLATAVSGAALVITLIMSVVDPVQVLLSSQALIITSLAFVSIGLMTITLASIATPLLFSIGLATLSIIALVAFVQVLSNNVTKLTSLQLDPTPINNMLPQFVNIVVSFVNLLAPITTLALISTALMFSLSIVSLNIPFIVLSVFTISRSLSLLANMNITTQISETMNSLVTSLTLLGTFNESVNNYVGINPLRQLQINRDLKFIESYFKKLSNINTNNSEVEGINNLSNALANLANTSNGLNDVAVALKAIAEATKELNETTDINVRYSVESLAQTSRNVTDLKSENVSETKQQFDTTNIETLLRNINNSIQGLSNITSRQVAFQKESTESLQLNLPKLSQRS